MLDVFEILIRFRIDTSDSTNPQTLDSCAANNNRLLNIKRTMTMKRKGSKLSINVVGRMNSLMRVSLVSTHREVLFSHRIGARRMSAETEKAGLRMFE